MTKGCDRYIRRDVGSLRFEHYRGSTVPSEWVDDITLQSAKWVDDFTLQSEAAVEKTG